MQSTRFRSRAARVAGVLVVALAAAVGAQSRNVTLMTSGALAAPLQKLIPVYERSAGAVLSVVSGGSVGAAPDSIPSRLQRGERADVLIMAAASIDDMIKAGKVVAGSRVDLARSRVGLAVRKGAPKPDIATVDALRRAILQAKSIAYSSSVSGVYVSTELFARLGVAKEALAKSRRIDGEPVAAVVARGEAEMGFQQISELRPDPGVDVVGPLPDAVQRVTLFSAAIPTASNAPAEGKKLIAFLASPEAAAVFAAAGLDSVAK
jgi:molybdate transport system substrate-binding protein